MNRDQSEVIANIVRQKVRQKEGVDQYTHVLSDGETWEYFIEKKFGYTFTIVRHSIPKETSQEK